MATKNIVPRATGEGGIGTENKHWAEGYFDELNVKVNNVDKSVGEELATLNSGKVSKSGDTLSGELVFSNDGVIRKSNNSGELMLSGGTSHFVKDKTGGRLELIGVDYAEEKYRGAFALSAMNEDDVKLLVGLPNGTLTWNGYNVLTGGSYHEITINSTYATALFAYYHDIGDYIFISIIANMQTTTSCALADIPKPKTDTAFIIHDYTTDVQGAEVAWGNTAGKLKVKVPVTNRNYIINGFYRKG